MTQSQSGPEPDRAALPQGGAESGLSRNAAPGGLVGPDPLRIWAHPLQPQETHFWDYWTVLVRHRWTVFTFLVVTVVVTTIWTFTTRPVFTAMVTLRIEKDEPRVLKFEEVVKSDPQQEYYQTQLKIISSRSLANRVIEILRLDEHPEFQMLGRENGWRGATHSPHPAPDSVATRTMSASRSRSVPSAVRKGRTSGRRTRRSSISRTREPVPSSRVSSPSVTCALWRIGNVRSRERTLH